jgi:hypothetical protein
VFVGGMGGAEGLIGRGRREDPLVLLLPVDLRSIGRGPGPPFSLSETPTLSRFQCGTNFEAGSPFNCGNGSGMTDDVKILTLVGDSVGAVKAL